MITKKGKDFLLYGSYGYTGALIAQEAIERGLRPKLAGRDVKKLNTQAMEQGLSHQVVPLQDAGALDEVLSDVPLVLHCAGPFVHTAQPMAEACLRRGVHYLDITGEISVFEALAELDAEARARNVMLLPGLGFAVVPSDCLASHLKGRLPSANTLRLAIQSVGPPSRGTAKTVIEHLQQPGMVRLDGKLIPVPAAWKTRMIDFGGGPKHCVTMPWGDISTAYHSTGIPNIEVYLALSSIMYRLMILARSFLGIVRARPVKDLLSRLIDFGPAGPNEEERAEGWSLIWGEVINDQGTKKAVRMRTSGSYGLTILTALAAVEKVLSGDAPIGFQTPSLAYDADFALELEGVEWEEF